MEVGAIQVPVNPKSTDGGARRVRGAGRARAGRHGRRPRLAPRRRAGAGDPRRRLFEAEPDGRGPAAVDEDDVAVMIPTSGTTGRSKLVMQTHLAYVMAGEGFPYWMGLTADDRLMTSLPLFHINAPAYSTLGSIAARASLVLLPGFSASGFLDAARRFGATEFNSIGAMLEILMRQPERADDADTPLRLCYTGPSPSGNARTRSRRASGSGSCVATRCPSRPTALIWRHGTRPFGTLGSVRQHPSSVTSTTAGSSTTGPRSRSAATASWSCATRRSCAATTRCPRRPRP